MSMDDNDGQMIFGDLEGLKLPDICLTGEEKPRKNLTQETCPDRGSNPGPLHDKRACNHLLHSGGLQSIDFDLSHLIDIFIQIINLTVKSFSPHSIIFHGPEYFP